MHGYTTSDGSIVHIIPPGLGTEMRTVEQAVPAARLDVCWFSSLATLPTNNYPITDKFTDGV
jgi:hypothetical protein